MLNLAKKSVRNAKEWKREAKASAHINIIGHYDESTLIDSDGKLIKLFELDGLDFVTQHQQALDIFKQRRNSIFKTFNSNCALYYWIVRSRAKDFPNGEYSQTFASTLNERYKRNIENANLYKNQLMLALVSKAPEGKINKVTHWIKSLNHKLDSQAYDQFLAKIYEELQQVTNKFLSALQPYGIRTLTVSNNKDHQISKSLTVIDRLINLDHAQVPLLKQNAAHYLIRKRLFFNARSGTIEIRSMDNSKRFATVLSLKDYTNGTYAGLLDNVQRLPIEMIITQSFRFFDTYATKEALKNQQKDFQQINDESISQTEQLSESLDEAASGTAGFGLHHLSILCLADSQEELNRKVADIVSEFSKFDMVCIREDVAAESIFWAQLPGNFSYIIREAPVSTKNLAGFVSLHNDAQGKAQGNHWGSAVTVLETISGSQYFFNHHYKDVGNTLIFGSMGSGKTLFMGFVLTQSLKFGGKRVVFDKDRGLEILIRALGGNYEILRPGIATGFNPCQLSDTPENRAFLNALFKKMLTVHGQSFDEHDAEVISKVVMRLYTLPAKDRRLCHIAPYFGVKARGSLRARFDEWHSAGAKAWVFDNEEDKLNLDKDILGFELGSILKDEDCKTPTLMYLKYRVDQAMEGKPGAIYIDEGWLALQDEYFKQELDNQSRTPRKKNKFLCLATQSADDAANSDINKILCETATCKIYFPNPTAKRETYIDKLGVSEREYELIKTLDSDNHYFIINFGYGKESVVARVHLNDMLDEIAVISGRESTVKLLDQIRQEVGDDPNNWLPIFYERRKTI